MKPLYSATIMDHFRRPRNYGTLDDANVRHEISNPVCGDRIRLSLRLADGIVAAARFKGDGCAISKAAASILTEMIHGRMVVEAAEVSDAELLTALDAEIAPSRLACALLPLEALRRGLGAYRRSGGDG